MKVTPWFPHAVKPVRHGTYQVLMDDGPEWCYFGPKGWGWAYANRRWAESKSWRQADGATQGKVWRGVRKVAA